MAVTDLFLSLPWLFLLITARALMPLNVSPLISVLVTFLLLGLLGGPLRRACCVPRRDRSVRRILSARRGPQGFQDKDCFGFM